MENNLSEYTLYEEYMLCLDDLLNNHLKIYYSGKEISELKSYLKHLGDLFLEDESKLSLDERLAIELKLNISNICLKKY